MEPGTSAGSFAKKMRGAERLTSLLMNHFRPAPPRRTFAIESCCCMNDRSSTSLNSSLNTRGIRTVASALRGASTRMMKPGCRSTHVSPSHAHMALTHSDPSSLGPFQQSWMTTTAPPPLPPAPLPLPSTMPSMSLRDPPPSGPAVRIMFAYSCLGASATVSRKCWKRDGAVTRLNG